MRTSALLSILIALAAGASAAPSLDKRQKYDGDGGGKVADPADSTAPRRQILPAREKFISGAKTIKIRYGPYAVVDGKTPNSKGEPGMLNNYPDRNVEKPCDSCKIIGMSVSLEYPNGTEANSDSDMWLHHMVMYNEGADAAEASWPEGECDSHTRVGTTPQKAERFYASGNERSHSAFNLPAPNQPEYYGYPVHAADKFHFKIELMNMAPVERTVYVTLVYDYVEGHPEKFRDIKPVWLDAALCKGTASEVHPPKESGSFSLTSEPWVANMDGAILGIAGHLHDGGVKVRMFVDGKHNCDSEATYGGTPGSISPKPVMGGASSGHSSHGGAGDMGTLTGPTVHISNMSTCLGPKLPVKEVKKGQKWTLEALYDYEKHPGMLEHDGKQSDIMGIALMFVRREKARLSK